MKHLNTDIKFLAETEFPDGGPYLFGKDFGKRAKTAADDIRALKGIQLKGNRFSGSGDSNKKTKYQCSADWTSPSSQAKVHHSGSLTDLQNKLASKQLSFFQFSLRLYL